MASELSRLSGKYSRGIESPKGGSALRRLYESGASGTPERPGVLGRAIDFVSRPLYGIAGGAKAAITPGENILKEAYKGISGQEKETFSDVLNQAGWRPKSTLGKVARGVVGFGADVLLDPLTYTGVGALTKAGRAIKATKGAVGLASTIGKQAAKGERALLSFAGKPIIKGAGVLSALGKGGTALRETVPYISPAIQEIGKALSTKFRPKEIDPQTWNKLVRARQIATNLEKVGKDDAFDFAVSTRKEIDALIKKGAKKEDIENLLHTIETKAINVPDDFKPLYKKLTTYADQISERRQSIGKNLLDSEDYNYWLHSLTKEEREKLAKSNVDLNSRVFTSKSGSDISRKYVKVPEGILHIDSGTIYNNGKRIKKLPKGIPPTKPILPELQPLAEEARKYKSAEEFAGSKSSLFHVTSKEAAQSIEQQGFKAQVGDRSLGVTKGKGVFLYEDVSPTQEFAKNFARIGKEPAVVEAKVSGKIFTSTDEFKSINELASDTKLINKLKSEGFVGIRGEELGTPVTFIFDETVLKTKSQLTDIYNQATKTTKISPQQAFQQASIQEINQALGKQKFSTDIPTTAFEMGRRISRQEAGSQFLNMVRDVGIPSKKVLAGYIASSAPELKGLSFQPEVAQFIDKVFKAYTSDESTKTFLKMYDAIQNGWKGLVTFVNPAFHTRNAIGNLWQNYLADITNPAVYAKAGNIQQKLMRGIELLPDEKNILEAFKKEGLLGKGVFGADIERALEKEISKTINPVKLFLRGARKYGSAIEDNAKLAHFIDRLAKGYSPEQAAESVRKYLFDYADLTDFERNVLKRIFPFYTWTRKNLPLQLESLIQKPGKFATLGKGIAETEKTIGIGLTPEERKYLPNYLQDQLPIALGRTKKGDPRILATEGFIPAGDISKLGRPGKTLIDLLTPALKTPLELGANYRFYTKKPIQRFEGETVKTNLPFVGEKEVSPYSDYFLSLLRPIRELAALTGKAPEGKERPIPERIAKFLIGAKLQDIDIEKQKEYREYERREKLGKIRNTIERAKEQGNQKFVKELEQQERELKLQKYKIRKKK